MFEDKCQPRSHESEVQFWARALGVSPQRLIALVREVVNERLAVGVPLRCRPRSESAALGSSTGAMRLIGIGAHPTAAPPQLGC